MRRKESQLISDVLDSYLDANPLLAEKMAETRLVNAWNKTLGSSVARYTKNIYIKNRCLYVRLTSSVLKNELMYCREKLIANLNQSSGRQVIDNIIFL